MIVLLLRENLTLMVFIIITTLSLSYVNKFIWQKQDTYLLTRKTEIYLNTYIQMSNIQLTALNTVAAPHKAKLL